MHVLAGNEAILPVAERVGVMLKAAPDFLGG